MQRSGIIELVTEASWIFIVENLLTGGIQTEDLGVSTAIYKRTVKKSVIDKVVQRGVFMDTRADRTIEALVHFKIPYLRCHFGVQIHLILSRTAKGAELSWGLLEKA